MAMSFLMRGAASAQAAKQEQIEQERRKSEAGKLWRFFLNPKEEASIVFVDGELGEDGHLVPPRCYEHHMFKQGRAAEHYVCPERTQPEKGYHCPICEMGDMKGSYASLTAFFTIIDTRLYQPKKGPARIRGRKLLAVNPTGFELLNTYAGKRGGLAGWRADVKRSSENAINIGDIFDFMEKKTTKGWQDMFQQDKLDDKGNVIGKETFFLPADYEKEIVFRDEATLRKMGFGGGNAPSGFSKPNPMAESTPETTQVEVQDENFEDVL